MANRGRQNWECRHCCSECQVEEDETEKSEKILRCSSEKANEELKPKLHGEFLKSSLVK